MLDEIQAVLHILRLFVCVDVVAFLRRAVSITQQLYPVVYCSRGQSSEVVVM
jgi:hypothetical protein